MESLRPLHLCGATDPITLRPVTTADADALAALVVQLFQTELPGCLRGPQAGQLQFFRYLIGHELTGSTQGRFLAVGEAGAPVGTASMRLYGDLAHTALPPRLLSVAGSTLGLGDTLRVLATMLRSSLTGEINLRRGECFVHSVVVDQSYRGRGIGQAMMTQLEDYARRLGVHTALLRVIVGNRPARNLYLKGGYSVVSRTPPWADQLTLPSELLRKELL